MKNKQILSFDNFQCKSLVKEAKKEKYEFIDEHPDYKELVSKLKEVKKLMTKISKEVYGDMDAVEEFVEEKIIR